MGLMSNLALVGMSKKLGSGRQTAASKPVITKRATLREMQGMRVSPKQTGARAR